MITLDSLVRQLGYDESPYYWRVEAPHSPGSAHWFRSAVNLGVDGIYVFQRAPEALKSHYAPAPAVYVAEAENEGAARQIHRKLWNLCFAPFAIIVLPNQIRVYTGFNYSEESDKEGVLDEIRHLEDLSRLLRELNAAAVDTGLVWQSHYAQKLDTNRRVDRSLLKNIKLLGAALTRDGGLEDELANRLIGKYVYLKYLRDRGILSDEWMKEKDISPDAVFSLKATATELGKLVKALEEGFNGKIFPIDFDAEKALSDEHVKWVAAIFSGAKIVDRESTPKIVLQLHLPFKAYDFEYIPVETLSVIYEQFIFDKKTKGAVYTPEVLADYVISEMDSMKPLERGMRVLDPACGSGIFLVLIYRLLIEKEIRRLGRKLTGKELLDILEESIYGVEREADACYVAEFSLILTLLHYIEPRDLHRLDFRFPSLHNNRIFESDFFAIEGKESAARFRQRKLAFDWVIGNPPWIKLSKDARKKGNVLAYNWMKNPENKKKHPVGDNQIAEAFSWIATELLTGSGIAGLILPAPSLFNKKSENYRKRFFTQHEVLKVTNFANLRENIWGKRENEARNNKHTLPPAVFIYRPAETGREKKDIIHYGPFAINQLIETKDKPWVITINESEIKTLPPYEAANGDTLPWKLALWGTHSDRRIIERFKHTFSKTLKEICDEKSFVFCEGPQIREGGPGYIPGLKRKHDLIGNKEFSTKAMNKSLFQYSVPKGVLAPIQKNRCYIRKRGGEEGLKLTSPPHIIISYQWMNYIIFSSEDFLIPARQFGIATPNNEDASYLQAISVYLKSSLVAYYVFFHSEQWGVFRHTRQVTIDDVRGIPAPAFTAEQVARLTRLQEELVIKEKEEIAGLFSAQRRKTLFPHLLTSDEDNDNNKMPFNLKSAEKKIVKNEIKRIRKELQKKIDISIYEILKIPRDIRQVIEDFFEFRLPLDTPSQKQLVMRKPTVEELRDYARELTGKLDDFLMGNAFVRITVIYSDDLIESIVEVIEEGGPFPVDVGSIKRGDLTRASLLTKLAANLRRQVSQWVYVQRGLRLYDGPRVHTYKIPRVIDWTRTQARLDATEMIGELIPRHDH